MKKSLIAIAVLAATSSAAFAQSNVTIYGIVDAGITSERGGKDGNVSKVTSGAASASRIGFKGTEDLGGGLSAIFKLETGVKVDDGTLDNTTSTLFNREAYVGVSSKTAGTVTLGRQYTPYYETLRDVGDPFAMGYAGTAKNLFPVASYMTRNSNAVVYKTPNLAGFTGSVSYSLGEVAGDSTATRQVGGSLAYGNGPLNVAVAYNMKNNDTLTTKTAGVGHNTLVAANYDFKVVKVFGAWSKDSGQGSAPINGAASATATTNAFGYTFAQSADSRDALIGLTAPLGASGTLMASYIDKDDKEVANRDASQWALGYSYALSKRTSTYVAYAKIKNKNGAGYTVGNNTEAGSGDKAFNVGLKHSF
ncbi:MULTISPECIES: porin [unclassified Duganella]|uniref:porin n=1 Tax=unclassified Duganella TaxID=2636909 RepID=UPI0008833CF9|nr:MULTISPECIES: porin [unclassified Duganella]SDG67619.1 Outer membrane protein (porin) [Duganella sp. OV458]SDJ92850.1 Outer membrane protein (porin) [Duganella sp. OV510]